MGLYDQKDNDQEELDVIFGGDDEEDQEEDEEEFVGLDEADDSDQDSGEVQEDSEDDNMAEDESTEDADSTNQNQEGQQTMNGKSVQENVKERSVWKTVTLGAVSSGNMSIMRKEDEEWLPFSEDLSTIEKSEMQKRLEELQSNKDVWGGAIQIQMINKGDMDSPEMRFIDYKIPDEDEVPEDFEPAEDDEDQGSQRSGGSSRNRPRDQSSSSSGGEKISDAPRFRAELTIHEGDKVRTFTGHATAEDPQSNGQLLELAETRAIKRAIKHSPALHQYSKDVDLNEADKLECFSALNELSSEYEIKTEQIKEDDL